MDQTKVLVWKTQEGYPVRITHMSDEHIINAVQWLTDFSTNEEIEGVEVKWWIIEFTRELYKRLHPELVNG
ncbi:hypothetical protein Ro1_00242 [Raoultella phage Ro1]|uniref:Uncharacterized protein n=1 Tax=Raoultella phage Ro1 TaxID=2053702 RepID=A0A2H4YGZ3_9CAUD|nr:hypothetical protein HWB37_gp182 [Raoultella phage Ro1]AUE23447.1 hypothetical protein Ro1_00242 [Raoultella phage Ro1]